MQSRASVRIRVEDVTSDEQIDDSIAQELKALIACSPRVRPTAVRQSLRPPPHRSDSTCFLLCTALGRSNSTPFCQYAWQLSQLH